MAFLKRKNSKISAKSNVSKSKLEWNGQVVEVSRKDIRSLRLSITPQGVLRVSLPEFVSDQEALRFLNEKKEWITKHLSRIHELQSQETPDYSRIRFLGESKPLEVRYHPAAPRVLLDESGKVIVFLKPGASWDDLPGVLDRWYRKELEKLLEPLIRDWEVVMKVQVEAFKLKKMKTRWGTCNVTDHRIWFNTELIKHSYPCIEYIVVHEMCHLLQRGHGPAFKALMDKFLPHWRNLRHELNGKGQRW